MLKRLCIYLLCLLLLLGLSAAAAYAEDNTIDWNVEGNTLYIRGSGRLPDFSPGGGPWIDQADTITAVVVEEGITGLGLCSFQGLPNAKTILLPTSLTSMGGGGAFIGCTSLTQITIPEGVTALSLYLFQDCTSLKTVKLPNSLKTIAEGVFQGCSALEAVHIPAGVTTLPDYVFYKCASLEQVTLPEGLTSIGVYTFARCKALKTIDLPQSLTGLGEFAFGETGLTAIHLPDNIPSLEETFRGCTQLSELTLPSNLKTLGQYTLENCDALTQLQIPASVTALDYYAVANCDKLERVFFYADTPALDIPFAGSNCDVYFPADRVDVWLGGNLFLGSSGSVLMADMDNICPSHTFQSFYQVRPNTCLNSGIWGYRCTDCSAVELRSMPASGHTYYTEIVRAGADTVGYEREYCIGCGWQSIYFYDPNNLTYSDALLFIQNAMNLRDRDFHLYFWSDEPLTDMGAIKLFYDATTQADYPAWGDYLRSDLLAQNCSGTTEKVENGKYYCYAKFEFVYFTSAQQEQQVHVWVKQILEELALEGKSDLEKIFIIHDYVVRHVDYDYSYTRHNAYNAIADGLGVCQGYASLFTRLMAEAGLNTRYIVGMARELHAWNIVELDGLFYHIDTTWSEGEYGKPKYTYFLKGTEDFFQDHTPDDDYMTAEFQEKYPLAKDNYLLAAGTCGDGAFWYVLPDGTMQIFGSGKVERTNEWAYLSTPVKTVFVGSGITELDELVFWDLDDLERVIFQGDAPRMGSLNFILNELDAYYPQSLPGWQEAELDDNYGYTTWKPYLQTKMLGSNIRWVLLADGTLELFGSGQMDPFCQYQPWVTDSYSFIQKIIIHEGITDIGKYAFSSQSGLTEVILPSTLTQIGESAFVGCGSLTEITLPESLAVIGADAFRSCSALTDLTFPKSVTRIGEYAFSGCTGITELRFKGDAPGFNTQCFGSVTATGYYNTACGGWDYATKLYLGGDITWVGLETIQLGSLSDATVVAGDSLTITLEAVGDNLTFAWYVDSSLVGTEKMLTLAVDTSLNGKEFWCVVTDGEGNSRTSNRATITVYEALTENVSRELGLAFGDTVTLAFTAPAACIYRFSVTQTSVMSASLFDLNGFCLVQASATVDGCSLAYELSAGTTYLVSIGSTAWQEGDSSFLVTVTREHGNLSEGLLQAPTCTENGVAEYTCGLCAEVWTKPVPAAHNYENGICTLCQREEPIASGSFSDTLWWELYGNTLRIFGVGAIPDFPSFFQQPWLQHQSTIQTILIEEGVTGIGNYSFMSCSQVVTVRLPESLTRIGVDAFQFCTSLAQMQLPAGLDTIGESAFYNCHSLTAVTIPASVTAIGKEAFYNCFSIQTVDFLGKAPKLDGNVFTYVYAQATHPKNDPTWTQAVQDSQPSLTWLVDAYAPNAGDRIPGDVDCNGVVNTDDVVTLLLHISMPDIFGLQAGVNADFNADGSTTTDDAVMLLLHISMPDVFPL